MCLGIFELDIEKEKSVFLCRPVKPKGRSEHERMPLRKRLGSKIPRNISKNCLKEILQGNLYESRSGKPNYCLATLGLDGGAGNTFVAAPELTLTKRDTNDISLNIMDTMADELTGPLFPMLEVG